MPLLLSRKPPCSVNSQSGFSLMEVMIAAGLMGLVSLGVIGITKMGFVGQKSIQAKDDARTLTDDLATLLTDPGACAASLSGVNVAAGQALSRINDKSGAPRYEVGKIYGNRSLSLGSLFIGGPGTDAKTGLGRWVPTAADRGTAFLAVLWQQIGKNQNMAIGGSDLNRYVLINAQVNGSSQIVGCTAVVANVSSSGSGTAGFIPVWQTSLNLGNSVVFQSGSSIGINTTSPSREFEVAGSSNVSGNGLFGTLNVNGDASVGGAGRISSSLDVGTTGNINSNLTVGGNASIAASATIGSNASVGSNLTVGGTETVSGAATLNSTLKVSGTTNLVQNVQVGGNALLTVTDPINSTIRLGAASMANTGINAAAMRAAAGLLIEGPMLGLLHQSGGVGFSTWANVGPSHAVQIGTVGPYPLEIFTNNSTCFNMAVSGKSYFCSNVAVDASPNTAYKLNVGGDGNFSGTVYASGSALSSDSRLKEEVDPLKDSLKKLEEMRGVSFRWRNKKLNQNLQYGFIAQEVEKIFPNIVTKDAQGFESVSYVQLIPHLVESVKQIAADIHNGNADQETLRSKISDLTAREAQLISQNAEHAKKLAILMERISKLEKTKVLTR